MNVADLLVELYGRIPPLARDAFADVDPDRLTEAPAPESNTIAWLIWHLIRSRTTTWPSSSKPTRSGQRSLGRPLRAEPDPTTPATATAGRRRDVRPDGPGRPAGYLDVVDRAPGRCSRGSRRGSRPHVDRRWDPPVTMGVRLVSIADDSLQHVGQAAYVRGLLGL